MSKLTKIFFALLTISVISFSSFVGTEIYLATNFKKNCSQYIEMAARSTTVELAKENLGKAISFAEEHNITSGNSSLFVKYPGNDIGFWYKNLVETYSSLEKLGSDSALENSNVLMKIESLIEKTDDGQKAIYPDSIYEYPYQTLLFGWGILSVILFIFFLFAFCINFSLDNEY